MFTALVFFAVTASAVALGEIALVLAAAEGDWGWVATLIPLGGCVYVATGLLAWTRRPANSMGPLLCVGGLMWFASGAYSIDNPALFAVGLVTSTLPIAFVAHALLAFPSGRLRGLAARVLIISVYVVALVLEAPLYLFRPAGVGPEVLWIADRPDLVAMAKDVQGAAGLLVLGVTGLILLHRVSVVDRQQRRVLLPVYGCGFVVVLTVTGVVILAHAVGIDSGAFVTIFQVTTLMLMPVAFLLGVLLGGFARTGELEELGSWLGAAGARPDLQHALARALGDPTVRLAYRFGEGWVDGNGSALDLAADDPLHDGPGRDRRPPDRRDRLQR